MSKISLSPDANGTGVFTIASPNSNTSRTLTLPDDSGTIVTNSGNQAGSFTTLNTSGQVVFNDAGADVDFRVESDTDPNAFFVDGGTGNIGIGTATTVGDAGYKALTIGGNASGETQINFRSNAVQISQYVVNTSGVTLNYQNLDYLRFFNSAGERMRIDSSGNVGIGTSSPNTRLMSSVGSSGSGVVNALRLQNVGTTVGDGAGIVFTAGTSTVGAGIASTGVALDSADLRFYAGGNTERMRIDSSGNVAIGTTDSTAVRLKVQQGANPWVFLDGIGGAGTVGVAGANPLAIYTNGFERGRFDASGNLLVGTSLSIGKATIQNSISIRKTNTNAAYTTVIALGSSATTTIGTFSGPAGAQAIVTLRGGHHYGTAFTPGPMQMYQKMATIRTNGDGTFRTNNNQTVFVSTTGSGPTEPDLSFDSSTGVLTVSTAANQGVNAIVEVVWGPTATFTPA